MGHMDIENPFDGGQGQQPRLRLESRERQEMRARTSSHGDEVATYGELPHAVDYVRVLYKRRWLALTVFVIVTLTLTVDRFNTVPEYEAKVQLLIESEVPNAPLRDAPPLSSLPEDFYQTQYRLLRSRSLAKKALESLDLWDAPQFGGPGPTPRSFSLRRLFRQALSGLTSTVSGWFRDAKPADSPPVAVAETARQSRAIDALLSNLTVSPVRSSRLVDVSFRSTDPALAARVANAVARNYIEQTLEVRFMASKEASDWLGARLAEQRKQVEAAELAVQNYREQGDAVSLEDRQNIVVQQLVDLNAAVTRAKTERIEKQAIYDQLAAIQGNQAALDSFPAVLSNTFIQQLKAELTSLQRQQAQLAEKLGDRHPDLIKIQTAVENTQAKLKAEINNVVQGVRNDYRAVLAQEQSLTVALEAQKSEALALNRKAIEYGVLQRDAAANRQIFDTLLRRTRELGMSEESRASTIRIVDAAEVPRGPVPRRNGLVFMLALLAGSVTAVGLVFVLDYFDDRIKTPDELQAYLGIPFIGLLPTVEDGSRDGSPIIIRDVPADFAEAIRIVRTNVLFSLPEEGTRSLVVTSAGSAEGKTVVAANLAVSLAQIGQRVLLMDADMRRPRTHELLRQKLEPGLSNLIVGESKATETVRETSVPGLWLLPAGRVPPNPAELLGSNRFRDFLASLGEHFEWVIIDSPPVMPVTDAALIAHLTSGVLFVVRADHTSRGTAHAAQEQLGKVNARVTGGVLNHVDLQRNPWYYSRYYRREYGKYYSSGSQS